MIGSIISHPKTDREVIAPLPLLTSLVSLHHSAAQEHGVSWQSNQCRATEELMHFAKGETVAFYWGEFDRYQFWVRQNPEDLWVID